MGAYHCLRRRFGTSSRHDQPPHFAVGFHVFRSRLHCHSTKRHDIHSTLKADVCVGLEAGTAEKLDKEDPTWRVSGKYAVVQFCARS